MANVISKLEELTAFDDADLFVVAQHDKYICTKYNTCRIDGHTMMDMLVDYALSVFNFQDVAYRLSDEFSPYEHNHDKLYNKLSIELVNTSQTTYAKYPTLSSYVTMLSSFPDSKVLSIGNLFIDGSLVPVEVQLSSVCDVQRISFTEIEPMVGALKFVALNTIKTNSTLQFKSENFDGWLYPDGTTFDLSDFALSAQLKTLYGNYDNTTFTLPDFRTFLKLNGRNTKQSSSAIGWHDGITPLKRHTHSVNVNSNTTMYISIRMPANPREYPAVTDVNNATLVGGNGNVRLQGINVSGQNLWLNYDGEMTNFKNFCKELQVPGWENITSSPTQFRFDYADTILGAIDTYNGTRFLSDFVARDTIKLNWISGIRLNGVLNVNGTATFQAAVSAGTALPAHVIVPVMIYVGQRKRTILQL